LFFNPCQSSSSILVPLCFVKISLVFFYLCQVLFSGFLQFNGNFVDAQNNSKYRDWAPLRYVKGAAYEKVVLSGQTIKSVSKGKRFDVVWEPHAMKLPSDYS